jgi:hypothetical protein
MRKQLALNPVTSRFFSAARTARRSPDDQHPLPAFRKPPEKYFSRPIDAVQALTKPNFNVLYWMWAGYCPVCVPAGSGIVQVFGVRRETGKE